MRMVLAQHVADDGGRLTCRPSRDKPHLIHCVEDAPLDRLQAVADVGQGARHDDRHGIVEKRLADLVFDVYWDYGIFVGQAAVNIAVTGARKSNRYRRGTQRRAVVDSITEIAMIPHSFSARSKEDHNVSFRIKYGDNSADCNARRAGAAQQRQIPLDGLMRGGRIHYEGRRYDRAKEQFTKALTQYGATADKDLAISTSGWVCATPSCQPD